MHYAKLVVLDSPK